MNRIKIRYVVSLAFWIDVLRDEGRIKIESIKTIKFQTQVTSYKGSKKTLSNQVEYGRSVDNPNNKTLMCVLVDGNSRLAVRIGT